MLKLSARLKDDDFLGTAEDLAAFVTDKLTELGFGDRHRATERLVRFYAYKGLLSKPERASDDRRKANFGPLQVRQLLLARLLAERGWDLDRIYVLLRDNGTLAQLNKLIDELAAPTEAEKLFFKTRSTDEDRSFSAMPMRQISHEMRSYSETHEPSGASYPPPARPARKSAHATVQQLRHIGETEESPASALRVMIKKELMRDDLAPAARGLFEQLLSFNPTSPGDEPKTERWTKLRLSHWCEAHFNIDVRPSLTKQELQAIVDQFQKALMDKYL